MLRSYIFMLMHNTLSYVGLFVPITIYYSKIKLKLLIDKLVLNNIKQ